MLLIRENSSAVQHTNTHKITRREHITRVSYHERHTPRPRCACASEGQLRGISQYDTVANTVYCLLQLLVIYYYVFVLIIYYVLLSIFNIYYYHQLLFILYYLLSFDIYDLLFSILIQTPYTTTPCQEGSIRSGRACRSRPWPATSPALNLKHVRLCRSYLETHALRHRRELGHCPMQV